MRLTRRGMDRSQAEGSTASPLRTEGLETEPTGANRGRLVYDDPGRGSPGKPVGAIVAAAKVLRTLHASERPLNASEVARAAGLQRDRVQYLADAAGRGALSGTM